MWLDATNAPYVLTKPMHQTQRLVKTNDDGSIIIHLLITENYEFERLLLGFGNGLEVLQPEGLRNRIKSILEKSAERYQ